MANIPVERKGGSAWWAWLLGLLALAALVWLVAEMFDDEPDADELAGVEETVEPTEQPEPIETTTAVTSFSELAAGTALVGRRVDLGDMRVLNLTGDSSFVVAPEAGSDEGALIVLTDMGEWRVGPGDGSDGEYDVNEGDSMDVEGTIRAFDQGTPDYADLSATDRDRVMRQGVYISAGSVDLQKHDD